MLYHRQTSIELVMFTFNLSLLSLYVFTDPLLAQNVKVLSSYFDFLTDSELHSLTK